MLCVFVCVCTQSMAMQVPQNCHVDEHLSCDRPLYTHMCVHVSVCMCVVAVHSHADHCIHACVCTCRCVCVCTQSAAMLVHCVHARVCMCLCVCVCTQSAAMPVLTVRHVLWKPSFSRRCFLALLRGVNSTWLAWMLCQRATREQGASCWCVCVCMCVFVCLCVCVCVCVC